MRQDRDAELEETILCVCDGIRRHGITRLVVDPVMIARAAPR
jgi:hydroxymethylpyrimidine/phosphomethylpyrimidine kinase